MGGGRRIEPPGPPRPVQIKAPVSPQPPSRPAARSEQPSPLTIRVSPRENRVPFIDTGLVLLTGFYEAVPAQPDENSAFSLQINQVGQQLVGWFSGTDDVVPNASRVATMPPWLPADEEAARRRCQARDAEPSSRIGLGTLLCLSIRSSAAKGSSEDRCFLKMYWERSPACRGDLNEFDLDDKTVDGRSEQGWLVLERERPVLSPPRPSLFSPPRFDNGFDLRPWLLVGVIFAGTRGPVFDRVERVSTDARLPWHAIEDLDEPLRGALAAKHIAPLPISWLRKLLRMVVPVEDPSTINSLGTKLAPETEGNIEQWQMGLGPVSEAARENALRRLVDFHVTMARLRLPWHRSLLRDLLINYAQAGVKATLIGGSTVRRSYFDIYADMIAEEYGKGAGAASFLEPIAQAGAFPAIADPARLIRYLVKFEKLSFLGEEEVRGQAKKFFDKELDTIRKRVEKAVGWVVPFSVGLYELGVTRQAVEIELDGKGRPLIDSMSGNPKIKRIIEERDLAKGITDGARLTAVAVSIGVGDSGPPPPVAIPIASLDLTYSDFAGCEFDYASASALPSIKLGNVAEITPVGTSFLRMRLPRRNSLEVWGSETEAPSVKSGVVEKGKKALEAGSKVPQSLGEAKKAWDAFNAFKEESMPLADGIGRVSADFKKLVGLQLGFGYVQDASLRNAPKRAEPLGTGAPVPKIRRFKDFKLPSTLFSQDNVSIDEVVQGGGRTLNSTVFFNFTNRDLLELFAAAHLAVLLNRGAKILMRGYASPEGPAGPLGHGREDPYNLGLSQDRADAVAGGLADGMELYPSGSWVGVNGIETEGLGELPSREQGGCADPPSTLNEQAFLKWCKDNPREIDKWPAWRRVDVEISGFGILRLLD